MTHPAPTAHQLTFGELDITYDVLGVIGTVDAASAAKALPRLRRASAAIRWLHGDLFWSLCDWDPARMHEAVEVVEHLDLDDKASLGRSISVSMAFPRDRRHPGLSWSHHRAVTQFCTHSPEVADAWLAEAEANRWTVHQLEAAIRDEIEADRADREPPLPLPKPWHERHRQVLSAIDEVFDGDPDAAVVLRADGTWRLWGQA